MAQRRRTRRFSRWPRERARCPYHEPTCASECTTAARSHSIAQSVVLCWRLRSPAGKRSSSWRLVLRRRSVVAHRSRRETAGSHSRSDVDGSGSAQQRGPFHLGQAADYPGPPSARRGATGSLPSSPSKDSSSSQLSPSFLSPSRTISQKGVRARQRHCASSGQCVPVHQLCCCRGGIGRPHFPSPTGTHMAQGS
jgi:hypothetical protein